MSKREHILQASLELAQEKGLLSLRISEIAIRADIGKSTIYEYFQNKEELMAETIRFMVENLINVGRASAATLIPAPSFIDALKELVRQNYREIKNNSLLMSLMFDNNIMANTTPEFKQKLMCGVKNARLKYVESIKELFSYGVEQGFITSVPSDFYVASILNIITISCFNQAHKEKSFYSFTTDDEMTEEVVKLILKILN